MTQPTNQTNSSERQNRRRLALLAVGAFLIIGLVIVSFVLHERSDVSHLDSSPAPRDPPDSPYIPSHPTIVKKMVEMAELTEDDVVFDLGCGDGRIMIAAAKQSGCRAVGFDIDPELVRLARENAKANGVEHLVTVEQRDVLTVDLSQATVVMIYLLPWIMEELIPQFDEMRPGSRIVAHDFRIAGCKPDKTVDIRLEDAVTKDHHVHLWIAPLKKGTAFK